MKARRDYLTDLLLQYNLRGVKLHIPDWCVTNECISHLDVAYYIMQTRCNLSEEKQRNSKEAFSHIIQEKLQSGGTRVLKWEARV